MKVYQTSILFQDEPIELSVGIGDHSDSCVDKTTYQWGGGFFTFGSPQSPEWEFFVHGQRFMTNVMHEVVEGITLLQGRLFNRCYSDGDRALVMTHDEFTTIIDRAAPAMNNIVNVIGEAFDSDMYNLLPPDKCPEGWEVVHDCDTEPEKKAKGKKKAKK